MQILGSLCAHTFYPWAHTSINNAMDNAMLFMILSLAVPGIVISLISIIFNMTPRKANNMIIYINISLICFMFFIFYWYIALPLSIAYCYFIKWSNPIFLKDIEEEELHGITTIGQYKRDEQKKIWDAKSETEKLLYLEEYKRTPKPTPNIKLIISLCCITPIIMIIIFNTLGLKYKLY